MNRLDRPIWVLGIHVCDKILSNVLRSESQTINKHVWVVFSWHTAGNFHRKIHFEFLWRVQIAYHLSSAWWKNVARFVDIFYSKLLSWISTDSPILVDSFYGGNFVRTSFTRNSHCLNRLPLESVWNACRRLSPALNFLVRKFRRDKKVPAFCFKRTSNVWIFDEINFKALTSDSCYMQSYSSLVARAKKTPREYFTPYSTRRASAALLKTWEFLFDYVCRMEASFNFRSECQVLVILFLIPAFSRPWKLKWLVNAGKGERYSLDWFISQISTKNKYWWKLPFLRVKSIQSK